MPETTSKHLPALPEKRPRSGLYSWVSSKKLPQGRAFQAIRRELTAMRGELVAQHGGERITPDAAILVDSVVEALGVQKLLGLYVRKYGVIDAREAKRGRLELSPILSKNWISYGNSVRQGILALKELDGHTPPEQAPTIAEIIRESDEAEEAERKAAEAAQQSHSNCEADGPGGAQDERTVEGEAKDQGVDEDGQVNGGA